MEEEEARFYENNVKKSRSKYLTLGLPIVLGLMLVTAAALIYVAYNHSFTKTLNVFSNSTSGEGNPINEYISIVGGGDLGDSLINCDRTSGSCTVETGEITLLNNDTVEHNCTLTTPWNANVAVSYSAGNMMVIPAGGMVNFTVMYTATQNGMYPMTTAISCP